VGNIICMNLDCTLEVELVKTVSCVRVWIGHEGLNCVFRDGS
jgi:hypothetical protein